MQKYCMSRHCTRLHLVISTISVVYVFYIFRCTVKINFNATTTMMDNSQNTPQLQSHHATYEPKTKYNLMEESYGKKWKHASEKYYDPESCTVEFANAQKLQQDHPCVLRLIQDIYVRQPSPRNIPYKLVDPELVDPSDGQSKGILRLLRNHTNGFFVECGAFDGEYLSNTLYMERSLNWTGLLIEADQNAFHQLSSRNRKAYTAPVCLSTMPYPIQVLYDTSNALFGAIVERIVEKDGDKPEHESSSQNEDTLTVNTTVNVHKKQCFPLYSLLLAIGRTEIDYFSLDVEGSEYKILQTIPWLKVGIKTLTVEWNHAPEGEAAITRLMERNKFVKFGHIEMSFSREVVYVQDFLNDLRLYE